MPRKWTKLSPAAAEKQRQAIKEWHAENTTKIIFRVRTEKKARYMALAERRACSLSRLIQDYLDAECEAEGL